MKQARVRTESMVQRFAKKPISEGFDLWDRDYPLGALRLFIFKSETSPPFQLGPCIDAMAEISFQLNGVEDAAEQYDLAKDKYKLLQQPLLSELMRIKKIEIEHGGSAALAEMETLLHNTDPAGDGSSVSKDTRKRPQLARCYSYYAELLLSSAERETDLHKNNASNNDDKNESDEAAVNHEHDEQQNEQRRQQIIHKAIEAATLAVKLNWDRVHTGLVVLGDCYMALKEYNAAHQAYHDALVKSPKYVEAIEKQIDCVKEMNNGESGSAAAELRSLLDRAIEAHPRASFMREKAFLIAESQGDDAALAYLNPLLTNPPVEEAESSNSVKGSTIATLYKAKAAILADGSKLNEALECARKAHEADPKDEEAQTLVNDIEATINEQLLFFRAKRRHKRK